MANIVYHYFNIRCRGELPRFLAAVGKLAFEDHRLTFSEWPGECKSKTPYGQIPALEVDGHWYSQKLAISLFFARKAGLYPTSGNPVDTLKYDYILTFTEDVLEQINQALVDKNFHNKPEKLEKLKADVLDTKLPLIEKLFTNATSGYIVGNKISICDLSLFDVVEHVVDTQGKAYLNAYPKIKKHFELIGQEENLKKYIASRPPPIANL